MGRKSSIAGRPRSQASVSGGRVSRDVCVATASRLNARAPSPPALPLHSVRSRAAPPATPCTTRSATSANKLGASAQPPDAIANVTHPIAKTRARPKRSPSAPPKSMSALSVSRYPLITHCSPTTTQRPAAEWSFCASCGSMHRRIDERSRGLEVIAPELGSAVMMMIESCTGSYVCGCRAKADRARAWYQAVHSAR
jgi:hypothetical protein